ncbi:NAD(P)/FAD-dependent oxidoreductase [Paenibacillus sp. VCA1]|uniref:NAD(P)/FAD-dependent oxidoreductase n=1 Tax=Paenibacillus sp. VCA1 TaxID=3039148 RepID=UPI002871EAEE|nr:NAD(P)/FAD-dependent oxidoreductase [Paenibacillus sp. VCA1]MDR9854019.1 NAD(P)/FAD-dependent oxidoreductase [Paenibacillus sp. VCA1]
MIYDCAIVGGGPAGLNAALVLGRARRNVAIFDDDQPRNRVTRASHGFITRDGVTPADFRRIAYEEVLKYPSVRHWQTGVTGVRKTKNGFCVLTASGKAVEARKLIFASGLKEVLPNIEGLHEYYGKSVFNCPYCDGWEMRDRPLAVISEEPSVFHMAKLLYNWSKDLIVCTNGGAPLTDEQRQRLESRGIRVIRTQVVAFSGHDGQLESIRFADGSLIERGGAFITPKFLPKAEFKDALGYETNDDGGIAVDAAGRSSVKGIYAAGDAAYVRPSQVVYAAAAGSKVAITVNMDLTDEDFGE